MTLISNQTDIAINESKIIDQEFQKYLQENVIYQTLKIRFKEYKAAYRYFRQNYLSKQENDAIKKASLIQKCIKILESGHDIDETIVPFGVSPEYINNCTKKERHEIYSKLLKEINKNKKECIDRRAKFFNEFQNMAKKDQIKKVIYQLNKNIKYKNQKTKYNNNFGKFFIN